MIEKGILKKAMREAGVSTVDIQEASGLNHSTVTRACQRNDAGRGFRTRCGSYEAWLRAIEFLRDRLEERGSDLVITPENVGVTPNKYSRHDGREARERRERVKALEEVRERVMAKMRREQAAREAIRELDRKPMIKDREQFAALTAQWRAEHGRQWSWGEGAR